MPASNLDNPVHALSDGSIVSNETHIVAGAAGWVDTDLSAVLGTDNAKIWVVNCIHVAAGSLGVRTPGDTTDSKYVNNHSRLVHAVAGHLEFYRDAGGDTYYQTSGWVK